MQAQRSPLHQALLNEVRQIARDPLLKWMMAFPILITLALRFGMPALADVLWQSYQFDLTPYYLLIMSMQPALMPGLIGTVIGFSLLDMKDDGSLMAMKVTPLQIGGYLRFKLMLPMLICIPFTAICLVVADLYTIPWYMIILISISAALLAPIFAILLLIFAKNKVEGLALTKVINAFMFPPIIAWFFPGHWNWLFGLLPTWWPMKSFWLITEQPWMAVAVMGVGILVQIIWIALLWRLAAKRL